MSFPFNRDKKRPQKEGGQFDLFDTTPTYKEEVEAFIETWNSHLWLPKVLGTDRQCRAIRNALSRPFFAKNWRGCFSMLAKSSFVWSKMKPPLDIDWYLRPDNFDKIMEGKYLDDKYQNERDQRPESRSNSTDEHFS